MPRSASEIGLVSVLGRRLFPLTLVVGILMSVSVPLAYYVRESNSQRQHATVYAQSLADRFGQLVLDSPALWKYQTYKYSLLIQDLLISGEVATVRVRDQAGQPVAGYEYVAPEAGGWWDRHTAVGTAPIFFNNRKVGTVEVGVTLGPMLREMLVVFLVFSTIGVGLALLVYFWPMWVVEGKERQVQTLLEDVRQSNAELQVLFETARRAALSPNLPDILPQLGQSAVKLVGADASSIRLVDPSGTVLEAVGHHGVSEAFADRGPVRVGEGLTGQVALSGEPVVVEDLQNDGRNFYREQARAEDLHSAVLVPLRSRDRIIGVLTVYGRAPRRWGKRETSVLEQFGNLAAVAMENARLHQETADQRREAEIFAEIARDLSSSLELDAVLRKIIGHARELCGSDMAFIAPYDASEGAATIIAYVGTRTDVYKGVKIFPGKGIGGKVLETREPFITDDYLHDPRLSHEYNPLAEQEGFVTNMALPITRAGEILGLLWVVNRSERLFTTRDQLVLTKLANQAAIAFQNARLYQEAKQSYDALMRTQDRLVQSEKLRALGEMAGGVAHDFNNLLAAILGRAQYLLLRLAEGAVAPEEARRSLGVIERSARDGGETVRRLLEFTRATPRLTEAEAVDVKELVASVVAAAQPRWKDEAEARGAPIEVVQEVGGVPPLVGNPAELREVLLNLVFNAIEAMPEGGTLTLSSWAEGGNVWLAVKDTGVGIPEEIRSRIFDPFFTTKGVQSSGLGLSVSYGIIHRHGGEITVESQPGRGTTFTVRLPRREAPAPRREVAPRPAAAGLRVLVVDDEEDVREALRDLLQAVGHEVYEAGSGPQGLEVLGAQEVELVCTDLGMPGMTGWEVAERVKARWPDLAVALITGWGAGVDPEELKAHGVDFLITKPFEMNEIQRVLSEAGRSIGVGR